MSYRKFYGDKKKAANTLRLRAQRVQVRNASGISRWRRLFTERSDMSMEWQWRGVQVCRRVCMRVQLSGNVCVSQARSEDRARRKTRHCTGGPAAGITGSPGGSGVKNRLPTQELWARSLGPEDPLEGDMAPPPALLPGESHGQGSLAGCSPRAHKRVGRDLATKQQQLPTQNSSSSREMSLRGFVCLFFGLLQA